MNKLKNLVRKRLLEMTSNKVIGYHGSDFKFDKFELLNDVVPKAMGTLKGLYFAKNEEDALEYGKFLYTVEISYNKVFSGDPFKHMEKVLDIKPLSWGSKPEDYEAYRSKINKQSVMSYLNENGYDMVYIPSNQSSAHIDEYIVFDASQVKVLKVEELNQN